MRINVTAPSPFTLSVLASADAAIYDSAPVPRARDRGRPLGACSGAARTPASYGAYYVSTFLPRREIVLDGEPRLLAPRLLPHVIIRQVAELGGRALAAVLGGAATHTSGLDWNDFTAAGDRGPADGVGRRSSRTGPASSPGS